jgi:DNA-binding transcriptional ArsR family regulator
MGARVRLDEPPAAISHPIRRAIVARIAGGSRALSPSAFGHLAGMERTRQLYRHFDYLKRDGLIELAYTEAGTTVEKFYDLTAYGRRVARSL